MLWPYPALILRCDRFCSHLPSVFVSSPRLSDCFSYLYTVRGCMCLHLPVHPCFSGAKTSISSLLPLNLWGLMCPAAAMSTEEQRPPTGDQIPSTVGDSKSGYFAVNRKMPLGAGNFGSVFSGTSMLDPSLEVAIKFETAHAGYVMFPVRFAVAEPCLLRFSAMFGR